jgi:hypothetical protein
MTIAIESGARRASNRDVEVTIRLGCRGARAADAGG